MSDSTGTWTGSFGDTLTGVGYDARFDYNTLFGSPPASTDNYILNCQGGDLVQDTTADLQGSLITNFNGASTSQVFVASSGSSSSGSNSCGGWSSCGGGSSGTYETINSFNAIDVTDMNYVAGGMSATENSSSGGAYGSEVWTFSNGTQSLTLDLLGSFSAAGFSFANDTGLVNQASTLESYNYAQSGGTAQVVQGVSTYSDPNTGNPDLDTGTVITYSGSSSSGCTTSSSGGSSCGSTSSGCGSSSGSSSSGCGSSSSSSGCSQDNSQWLTSAGCH